jgi:uncharacterized protein
MQGQTQMATHILTPLQANTLWWNDGSALRSRLFDALSLMFPVGEQFFLDAAQDWLRSDDCVLAASPALILETQRFIREEASHQRAHRLYNTKLAAQLPVAEMEQGLVDAMVPMTRWPLARRLVFMAAFEHLTALLSHELLRSGNAWLTSQDNYQARLWRWHCAEELAHHSVSVDILRTVPVSFGWRWVALTGSALYLLTDTLGFARRMCAHDVQAGRASWGGLVLQALGLLPYAVPSVLRMLWGMRSFVRNTAHTTASRG